MEEEKKKVSEDTVEKIERRYHERRKGERRKVNIPVPFERRKGERRKGADRREKIEKRTVIPM
jgi:allophanate hydrolase subunit 1